MTLDDRRHPLAYRTVLCMALLSTALSVGSARAHVLELLNKIDRRRAAGRCDASAGDQRHRA